MPTTTTTVTSATASGVVTTQTTTEAIATPVKLQVAAPPSPVSQPAPPTIDLYFVGNTRGTRIAWLLEELEYGYTHVVPSLGSWCGSMDWSNRDLVQAAYSRMGHDFSRLLQTGLKHAGVLPKMANKVPVVKLGEGFMFESAAIIQIILENDAIAHGKLSGQPVERAQFLQWLNFAETILEHSSSKVITGGLFDNGPDSRSVAMATARAGMAGQVDMIERELADHGGEYLLKSGFSACDIACGYSVINSFKRGLLDVDDKARYPNANAWMHKLLARDGCTRGYARTKVVAAGRYDCQPGAAAVLIPGSGADFEDPTPEWMAELVAKYAAHKL